MSSRVSKRHHALPAFGAPNDADDSLILRNVPSSATSSRRHIQPTNVPSLTTLCTRKFAAEFVDVRNNELLWERLSTQLRMLPDTMIPKLFRALRAACPTYLKHEFIVTYMLRGPSVTFTDDLPGVSKRTISDVSRLNARVRELEISGFGKIPDNIFASTLRHLKELRVLILRGCSKVGAQTISVVTSSCPDLKIINLNYTSANPASVAQLVTSCKSLEVLKVAGIRNWTDATFTNFFPGIDQGTILINLRTLKIRQTQLGDTSISFLINLCPNLQSLDASFTLLKRPASLISTPHVPPLQKLSLTSTSILPRDLAPVLSLFPQLRTLSLGALGVSHGSQASIGNTSAMTMDDAGLGAVTDALADIVCLERISLVGNTKLGMTAKHGPALSDFVSRIGRKCKRLNLAGIPNLRSADLAGLLPKRDGDDSAAVESLVLNNTGIDDEAGIYIAACNRLRMLGVAGTRLTSNGLYPILNACPELGDLDLTSCRGINVVERRRFFEVWEEQRSKNSQGVAP
ncbi:hypothetical protein AX15_001176 [Amanita polypyramis BW_CC]|nr:hypothetical protein AX15_001176 [Amanita polypyramis BW_CC]